MFVVSVYVAGGFGHVYGHEVVIYFGKGWTRESGDEEVWREALEAPGAAQMAYHGRLMEGLGANGLSSRRSAPELVRGDRGQSGTGTFVSNRIEALVADGGRQALVYTAEGGTLHVDPAVLVGEFFDAWYFDPRRGTWTDAAGRPSGNAFRSRISRFDTSWAFDPPGDPGEGNDWVLLLTQAGTRPRLGAPR